MSSSPTAELTVDASSGGLPRNPSRFQVNKVNGGSDSPEAAAPSSGQDDSGITVAADLTLLDNGDITSDDIGTANGDGNNGGRGGGKQVQFSVGSKNINADDHEAGNMGTVGYGTTNLKSFRNVQTADRIPHQDHYRNIMSVEGAMAVRPTLAELHDEADNKPDSGQIIDMKHFVIQDGLHTLDTDEVKHAQPTGPKFGWVKGVLMRCILSILGTMLYLRISWMAGVVGIGWGIVIIALSTVVTILTTISMCAICTNGEVKGGGAYFMISRSLGPEFGGSIGIIFSLANAVAAGMCAVGFAETVQKLLDRHGILLAGGDIWDIRVIALITVLGILGICMIGVSFESKIQTIMMVALIVSIVVYVVGTFLPPDPSQIGRGMTGYSLSTITENFAPNSGFTMMTFFEVFGVFFPACTGIMAGANISGDLADPSSAIPKGTILGIIITSLIYATAVFMTGGTVVRYASGEPIEEIIAIDNFTNESRYHIDTSCRNTTDGCKFGLLKDYQIWEMEGAFSPLIFAGIFAATLSSALGAFISAPKVFQAVCRDRLFPKIHWFARGYGRADEPRRGYALTFVIATLICAIGELNVIALIISNFFLMSYTLVNYACFDASFSGSPGFRPGFRYYNKWLALVGAILCLTVMFIISWWNALITFAFVAALYVYILYRKPDVNWGSSSQAHSYKAALQSALKLSSTEEHVKNYRPQILVLTGNPVARPSLVDFAANITQETSLLICGHVVLQTPSQKVLSSIDKLTRQMYKWFNKRKVKGFYVGVAASSIREGAQFLLQTTGIGKMKPNVLMIGFKNSWKTSSPDQILEYFNILHDAFDNNCGVAILHVSTGLDFSESMTEHHVGDTQNLKFPEPSQPLIVEGSSVNVNESNRALSGSESNNQFSMLNDSNINIHLASPDAPFLTPPNSRIADRLRYDSLSSFAAKFQVSRAMRQRLTYFTVAASLAQALLTKILKTRTLLKQGKIKTVEEEKDKTEEQGIESSTLLMDETGLANNVDGADDQTADPSSPGNKRRSRHLSKKQMEVLASINQFQTKLKKANVHVWWLFDDGGLGLLVPHLLTVGRSYLEGAKLRVFTVSASRSQLQREQRSMAALLSRFRIDYSDVYVIPDLAKKPSQSTIRQFEELIAPFRLNSESPEEESIATSTQIYIADSEYLALKGKTYRQLRTRELLLQHSKDASLILLTLPIPRKGAISAGLYMAWLETLTKDLPPTLLLRGNQQSVLTFYS